jgi:enterochelin esterase-like enzyme
MNRLRMILGISLLLLANPDPAAADKLPQVQSGRIERLADFESSMVPPRRIDVWLPDGYPAHGPYAVVYMQDGQMLFDATTTWNQQEWRVDEVAGALIAAGSVRPFIVVGIGNAGAARHSEYFPQKPFEALDADQQAALLALEREPGKPLFADGVYADRYLRFVVEELKPAIDARFRTHRGPEHTMIMGSSMGGLISLYALTEYPQVFGAAACLSTHWPGIFPQDRNPVPDAFIEYLSTTLPGPAAHRIYFDHGTATLDAAYPQLQQRVDAVMRRKGYDKSNWTTRVFEGAEHTEAAWSARLAEPLRFLLAPATVDAERP